MRALILAAAVGACDAEPEPPVGGTAVVGWAGGPVSANPLVATDSYSREMNAWLLYMPLLKPGPGLAPEPWLAESVTREGDTAAVLRLRRDVRWSDGVPTTAHDAAFTLELALDTATAYANAAQLAHIHRVEAQDSFTLRLSFDRVREPLLALTQLPVLPRHVLDTVPKGELEYAAFNLAPVTNGPFRVVEARPNDRWVFQANDSFPEALGGRPRLDRLVWRVIPESAAQLAELRVGEVDMIVGARAEDFDALAGSDSLRGIERPSLSYVAVAWNGRRRPLGDARVRRALTRAIDRGAIVEALRGGYGTPAAGPVPPAHWAHAPTLEPLTYDTAAARRELAAAGYVDRDGDGVVEGVAGRPLSLTLLFPAASDFNRDLAQVIQSDLGGIGVTLDVRPLDFATLIGTITGPERDFDAALVALDAAPRLDLRAAFHSARLADPMQVAGYAEPRLDSLLDRIEATPDRTAARSLWADAQERLVEDQPWTFLYYLTDLILARDRLRGVEADLRGVLHSAPAWWLDSDGRRQAEAEASRP